MSEQERHRRNEERLEQIYNFALDLLADGWHVRLTICADGIPFLQVYTKCWVKVNR